MLVYAAHSDDISCRVPKRAYDAMMTYIEDIGEELHRDTEFTTREIVKSEIALACSQIYKKGYVSVSTKRLDGTYHSRLRWMITRFLKSCGLFEAEETMGVRGKMVRFRLGKQSIRYRYLGSDAKKLKKPKKNKASTRCAPDIRTRKDDSVWVSVRGDWLVWRSRRWSWVVSTSEGWRDLHDGEALGEVCEAIHFGLKAFSFDGATEDDMVHEEGARDTQIKRRKEWFRKAIEGLSPMVRRIRNRCYHALTSCSKVARNLLKVWYRGDLEKAVSVDMSSTYPVLLVSDLRGEQQVEEQKRLIDLFHEDWFYRFINDKSEVKYESHKQMKMEFQKQCVFWRDPDEKKRPYWTALKEHFPEYALHILKCRGNLGGVGGLSDYLMDKESRIFVDRALVEVSEKGIPSVSIHDALLVPASCAKYVRGVLERVALQSLGFTPNFKIS